MSETGLFLNLVWFDGWCNSVQYHSFVEFVRVTHEGYWSVALWNCRAFPRLAYSDILGLSLYDWDLIFHEAFVEALPAAIYGLLDRYSLLSPPKFLFLTVVQDVLMWMTCYLCH